MERAMAALALLALLAPIALVSSQVCPPTLSSGQNSVTYGPGDANSTFSAPTNWIRTLSVPKFAPNCGTLILASLRGSATVTGTLSLESLEANPTVATNGLSARISMAFFDRFENGVQIPLFAPLAPAVDITFTTTTGYDGIADFGGTSGQIFSGLSATRVNRTTFVRSTDPVTGLFDYTTLLPFIGNDRIFFSVIAQAVSDSTGTGNLIRAAATTAQASVTVVYTFLAIPSIRSDPHFVAGNGLKYDFMGEPGKAYALYSDKRLHMNMHMIGVRNNPDRKGTWMDEISIMFHPYYNITVSAQSEAGTAYTAAHGTVTVNGKTMKSQRMSTMTRWHGLTIQRKKTRVYLTIQNLVQLEMEVVRAAFWEREDGPGSNYLNFKVTALNATDEVHGVMGQTFRETFSVTSLPANAGKDGQGVIEGKPEDYIVSGMYAADCKFCSGFMGSQGWAKADDSAELEISSKGMHSWVGAAGADSSSDENDLALE
eukprot:jgi/Mesvir1/13970/Mv12433-RA.1